MLTELRRALRLESALPRRAVLLTTAVIVPTLVLLAPVIDEIDDEAGLAVGVVLILWLLSVLLDHVASLSSGTGLEVFANENQAMDRQLALVRSEGPSFVEMCEYSTASVSALLDEIARSRSIGSVRLLIASPAAASQWQLNQIVTRLARLELTFPEAVAERLGIEIRCYAVTPSLRGRNFGDRLLAAGWYTHDRRGDIAQGGDAPVWGHSNALVLATPGSPGWAPLQGMWQQVFKNLWESAVPLREACKGVDASDLPAQRWLDAVGRPRRDRH